MVFQASDLKDETNYAIKRVQQRENTNSEKKLTLADSKNCPYIVRHYREWDEYAEYYHQVGFLFRYVNILYFDTLYFSRKRI